MSISVVGIPVFCLCIDASDKGESMLENRDPKRGAVLIGCAIASLCLVKPATAAVVDFETLNIGQTFGGATHTPGQPLFTQNGIDVTGQTYQTGTFSDFNLATIRAPGTDLFTTKHVWLDNINFAFDLSGLGLINSVSIEYREFGGVNNFAVNGGSILELPAMTSMPMNVAPGVMAMVDDESIHLTGVVTSFLIGGQELAVDNIVAVPEPACLTLLALGLGAGLLRRRR
jgi:hypothetical protein